jgi:hypothetical protein
LNDYNNACFIVKDKNGFAVAYVYYEEESGRRSAANLIVRDEARRIAANIVKLPELVQRPGRSRFKSLRGIGRQRVTGSGV